MKNQGFGTKAIHAGNVKNEFGTLCTPIYQSSTFVFDNAQQGGRRFALEEEGYIYSRLGNPTHSVLEAKIAALEGAEAGLCASSGMGSIASVFHTFLKAGDEVICAKAIYGCTFALLNHGLPRLGLKTHFVDTANLDEIKAKLSPKTRIIFLETPANPNLKITDLKAVSSLVHDYNKDILVVVDNTFATPFTQRPLELGANLVVHSATKYLNGHGDVVAGLCVGKKELIDQLRFVGIKDMTGSVLSPFDAYLITRGMKTLELRMQRHCTSAMEVAKYLEQSPKISKVYYPGLKSFEGYEVAKAQMSMFGAMISFELKAGFDAGIKLINSLKLCTLAVSLGDTETLIQHPASMTHSPYSREERLDAGIADGLIRLSVGLENVEDILSDLDEGLAGL